MSKLNRLYQRKLGQQACPVCGRSMELPVHQTCQKATPLSQVPEAAEIMRSWPQETQVLKDFHLEQGQEPHVMPDVSPVRPKELGPDYKHQQVTIHFFCIDTHGGIPPFREWDEITPAEAAQAVEWTRIDPETVIELYISNHKTEGYGTPDIGLVFQNGVYTGHGLGPAPAPEPGQEYLEDASGWTNGIIKDIKPLLLQDNVDWAAFFQNLVQRYHGKDENSLDVEIEGAVNVVDEPHEDKIKLDQYNKYPQGEEPDKQHLFPQQDHGRLMRIEGVSKNSGMIAIYPSAYAAQEIRDHFKSLPNAEGKRNLHVTLVYLGKNLSEEEWETLEQICDHVADAHSPMWCKTQGVGVFDHDDDGRPFYCNVDGVGMNELRADLMGSIKAHDIQIPQDYDFTPHMTIAYLADLDRVNLDKGSPNVRWECTEIDLVRGDKVVHTSTLGSMSKEAGGFGLSLHEIEAPSIGQGFTDNPADNHKDENTNEDVDLKLGDVEEPYSMSQGPINVRFEDDKKYNIVKGAAPKPISQDPNAREIMKSWPQETQVMKDMYLEDGHEPMIEEDQPPPKPPELERDQGYPIPNDNDGKVQDAAQQEQNIRNLFYPAIQAAFVRALKVNGPQKSLFGLDSVPGLGQFLQQTYSAFSIEYVEADWDNPEGQWQLIWVDMNQGDDETLAAFDRLDVEAIDFMIESTISFIASLAQNYNYRFEDFDVDATKVSVGLPDQGINENTSGSDMGRADQAIPRPPGKEKLLYGK